MKKKNYLYAGLVSLALSLILLVWTYSYWNRSYTYGYGDNWISKLAKHADLNMDHEFDPSGIVPVNVAYDKVLVPCVYKRDTSTVCGTTPITDRAKLLTFLKMLKDRDAYDYILCDVSFEGFQTEYDEELYSTIASMRDIFVACVDLDKVPEVIRTKTAESSYIARKVGDSFMKYDLILPEGNPNLALKMWKELDGGDVRRRWWGYTSNGKLCVRSFIPDFRYSIYDDIGEAKEVDAPNSVGYPSTMKNLGADAVDLYQEGYISGKFFDGKVILIGDLTENDMHTTITANQPGPVVVYNAYLALANGDHVISFWVYALILLVFWIDSMFLLRHVFSLKIADLKWLKTIESFLSQSVDLRGVWNGLKGKERFKKVSMELLRAGLSIAIALLTYNSLLILLMICVYFTSGVYVNIIFAGTIFSAISLIINRGN
ncbi:MAG: hypothetical protein IJN26_02775 [Bacteroidales bacterium]|nr:hypothetical protein [Bacteroidales bacterium]